MLSRTVGRQPGLRYVAIAEDLQRLIAEGRFAVGERLPSQHEMARQYGVSLTTLRAAIELLEQGGIVRSEHGLGTFVAESKARAARALVVDDDPDAVRLLRTVLERESIEVTGAGSKKQAVEETEKQEFDVIFLDLVMPGGTGVDALADFRRMGLTAPVVLVTGAADTQMISRAMEHGPLTLIRKPVQISQVRELLHSLALTGAEVRGRSA